MMYILIVLPLVKTEARHVEVATILFNGDGGGWCSFIGWWINNILLVIVFMMIWTIPTKTFEMISYDRYWVTDGFK